MASFGTSKVLVFLMTVTLLLINVTKIKAQDAAAPPPTTGLDTGGAFASPVSGGLAFSSVLISLAALLQHY